MESISVSAYGSDFRLEHKSLTNCHEFSDSEQSFHLIKYSHCPFAFVRDRIIRSIAYKTISWAGDVDTVVGLIRTILFLFDSQYFFTFV